MLNSKGRKGGTGVSLSGKQRVNENSYLSNFSSDVPLKSISSCFQLNLGDTAREEVDLEG